MADILQIAVGTVTMRPYVFAFLAAYLLAAVTHLGWRTTLSFTVVGYLIAYASEFSSIHTGFPYGWYYYLDATRDRELWIAGIPFFDSISYVFLAYCSYATALLVVAPVKAGNGDLLLLESRKLRRSFSVLLLGSLLQVFLDIIIDPVALQGYRWFLGQIYGYREAGLHFGVPMSNYWGWWLVGGVMIFALQRLEAWGSRGKEKPAGVANFPCRSLLGPLIYLGVLVFNITIAFIIGERLVGLTAIFIFVLPIAITTILLVRRTNHYAKDELAEHLRDFPWSPASGRKL
jgi:putative membrane protein